MSGTTMQSDQGALTTGQVKRANAAFENSPKELKHLVFGEGLMAPTIEGGKLFTVRKFRKEAHDFEEGDIVIGEFKDGLNVLLHITRRTKVNTFAKLQASKRALTKNGYYFDAAYFEGLKSYYPDLTPGSLGAVIFYEVLKVNGVPVVSHNEHTK